MNDQTSVDFVRTRKETAKILGISTRTLRRIELRGELKSTRISDRIVGYRDSLINEFLRSRTAA